MEFEKFDFDWPTERLNLYDAIFFLESNILSPFHLSDVVRILKQHAFIRNPNPEEHIQSLLDNSINFGKVQTEKDVIYYPGKFLFENKEFRFFPTEEEIAEGILVAGHRFYPWVSSIVSPESIVLKYNGSSVKRISFQNNFEHLEVYYNLFSIEEILNIVRPVDEVKAEPYMFYSAPAFDLDKIFEDYNFQYGDQLKVKVVDYNRGVLELKITKKEELFAERRGIISSDKKITENIINFIKKEEIQPQPIKGILDCYARFFFGNDFLEVRPSSWPKLLADSKEIGVINYQNFPYLAFEQQEDKEIVRNIYNLEMVYDGRCENLDDVFLSGNCDLNSTILTSYVIDNFFGEQLDKHQLLKNIIQIYTIETLSVDLNKIFYDLYHEFYQENTGRITSNAGGKQHRELRKKTLQLLEKIQFSSKQLVSNNEEGKIELIQELQNVKYDFQQILFLIENCKKESDIKFIKQKFEEIEQFWIDLNRNIVREFSKR